VSDERAPIEHLLRAVEELCRAGADAAALARERVASAGAQDAIARALGSLAESTSEWLANTAATEELRAGLRAEAARWELRAGEDPAARRLHDLVLALLELLEPEASVSPDAGSPRRTAQRGFRGRPRGTR
jgi:hypothetical protein